MKRFKFPPHVYVAYEEDRDGSTWLTASKTAEAAVEDDGPTRVATYKLVEVNELTKVARSKPSR